MAKVEKLEEAKAQFLFKIDKKFKDCHGIYAIKSKIDHKFYIGSAVNLSKRYFIHLGDLVFSRHKNRKLQNFCDKYGIDKIEFILLETVPNKKDLLKREQWYLDVLEPFDSRGFNICKIAGSSLGVKRSESYLEKRRQFLLGKKFRLGKKLDRDGLIHASKVRVNWIPVAKYDLDGNFICVYESIYIAAEDTGTPRLKITNICKFERKRHKEFIWRYAPDYICPNKIEPYIGKRDAKPYPVIQKSLGGEIINIYESAATASKSGKFNKDYIQSVCYGRRKTHAGFIWEYQKNV